MNVADLLATGVIGTGALSAVLAMTSVANRRRDGRRYVPTRPRTTTRVSAGDVGAAHAGPAPDPVPGVSAPPPRPAAPDPAFAPLHTPAASLPPIPRESMPFPPTDAPAREPGPVSAPPGVAPAARLVSHSDFTRGEILNRRPVNESELAAARPQPTDPRVAPPVIPFAAPVEGSQDHPTPAVDAVTPAPSPAPPIDGTSAPVPTRSGEAAPTPDLAPRAPLPVPEPYAVPEPAPWLRESGPETAAAPPAPQSSPQPDSTLPGPSAEPRIADHKAAETAASSAAVPETAFPATPAPETHSHALPELTFNWSRGGSESPAGAGPGESASTTPAPAPPPAGPALFELVVEEGPDAGSRHQIHAGQNLTIGRADGAEILLADPAISRLHCRVTCAGPHSVSVEDLGSLNGTLVNDLQAYNLKLSAGDRIRLGRTVIRVEELS